MPTTEGFLSAKTKDIEFCLKRETTMKSLRDCYTLSLLFICLKTSRYDYEGFS